MSVTVTQISDFLNEWAPWETAEEWDNAGVVVKSSETVTGVLCTLDITHAAIEAARAAGCNTIVSHHPVVFRAMKRFDASGVAETLLREGMNAVCAHTNLDKAAGGVSETLARFAGLEDVQGTGGFCCLGALPQPRPAAEFARSVGRALNTAVKYTKGQETVRTVCVVSGAGGDMTADAVALGADCLLTGEASHHEGLDSPIPVIAATHYATEAMIAGVLAQRLGERFPELKTEVFAGADPFSYIAKE